MHEDIFEPSKFDKKSQVSEHSCVLVLLPTIIYLDIKSMWPFLRRDCCFEEEEMIMENGTHKVRTMRPMIK